MEEEFEEFLKVRVPSGHTIGQYIDLNLRDAIRTALAQSTQSPVEQPPQTVAGELLAALQAMLVTFQYCIDNADLESVEQLVGKQARHAIEAATRHEGA
jgi:sugar (pentulose or hexulose) kinase